MSDSQLPWALALTLTLSRQVLVYRKSAGDDWNWDVPDYNQPSADAAASHWQRHRDEFPPELEPYKHLIWIESGEFAYHTAQIAMDQRFQLGGVRLVVGRARARALDRPAEAGVLATGGPTSGPDRRGAPRVQLRPRHLDRLYPNLVGRFQMLYDVAEELGIRRPTVVITEFGWVYDDIAPLGQAMNVDLPWAAELHAAYPEVLNAAIWYLGPGFGGIANRAQQLTEPLTEYSLQTYFATP